LKTVPLSSALLLCLATVCMSSSFIFVRESHLGASALAAYRLFLAAFVTFPLFFVALTRRGSEVPRGQYWHCVAPGVMFGLHLIGWNMGCRLTSASNATLLVNLVPVVLPFLLVFFVGERVTKREIWGTVVAFAGTVVVGLSDYHFSPDHLLGDGICFAAMLVLAVYIALVRKSASSFPSTWLFTTPVWLVAGMVCMTSAVLTGEYKATVSGSEWVPIAGLVLVPTLLGHGLSMLALRSVRGQIVALFSLGQCIPAAIMAWFIYKEVPHLAFYIAAFFIMAGVAVVVGLFRKPELAEA